MKRKFYAIARGKLTGVFGNEHIYLQNIKDFKDPVHKQVSSFKEGHDFIDEYKKSKEITLLEVKREPPIKIIPTIKIHPVIKNPTVKRKAEPEIQPNKKIKKQLMIFTDGGCSKNGFPDAKAGIGIYFEGSEYPDVSERIQGKQTNNRAELTAIKRTLEIVSMEEDILIHSDSEYSINGITGITKIGANSDIFYPILDLIKKRKDLGTKTEFFWVKGHTKKDDGNSKADALATLSLKLK